MLSYIGGKIKGELRCKLPRPHVVPLNAYTTYGIGGRAEMYFPSNLSSAKRIYDKLQSEGRQPLVIGNGSNILAADSGTSCPVICTRRLKGIVSLGEGKLLVLSGTTVGELLSYCKVHCLGGLEYLAGIPATVGGLTYMNGGAAGEFICENVLFVKYYARHNCILDNKKCNFSYKHSTMCDINCLILSIILKTYPSTRQEIQSNIDSVLSRRATLPKGRSCGCVFKNPRGDYAARLIELAGLKGKSVGRAHVSRIHSNFIISDGASAEDVKELIGIVKARVLEKFDVALEEEVVYIGDFNGSDG